MPPAAQTEPLPHDALARVPGYAPGDAVGAMRLAGGSINATYCVQTRAGRFVLRIYGEMSGVLGADHAREAALHRAAADAGLAPRIIYADRRFLITEHVTGRRWSEEDFGRPERLRQLGGTLRRLHAIPPPPVAPFDLGLILQGYADRIAAIVPAERAGLDSLLIRAREALGACASERRPQTIMHSDVHHQNLLDAPELIFLDWEYAAVTDPLFDLGCVLAYYPQARPHAQELLAASGIDASPEMLNSAVWLYALLARLWARAAELGGAGPAA